MHRPEAEQKQQMLEVQLILLTMSPLLSVCYLPSTQPDYSHPAHTWHNVIY